MAVNSSCTMVFSRRQEYYRLSDGVLYNTVNNTVSYTVQRLADQQTTTRGRADPTQVEAWAQAQPAVSDDVANEAKTAGIPVPVAPPTVDDFVPQGQPYPCAQFPAGCQDGIRVKNNATTADPVDVFMDPVTRDKTATDDATDSEVPDKQDQCKLYPSSVGCVEFGTDPGGETPKTSVSTSYAAEAIGLPSGCPPPIAMPGGHFLSYEAACDAGDMLRPVIVGLAAIGAMLMALAAIRGVG